MSLRVVDNTKALICDELSEVRNDLIHERCVIDEAGKDAQGKDNPISTVAKATIDLAISIVNDHIDKLCDTSDSSKDVNQFELDLKEEE